MGSGFGLGVFLGGSSVAVFGWLTMVMLFDFALVHRPNRHRTARRWYTQLAYDVGLVIGIMVVLLTAVGFAYVVLMMVLIWAT